jgi:hypothetical protein
MYVHATHTVHAVPDLRMCGGRFGGRSSRRIFDQLEIVLSDRISVIFGPRKPSCRNCENLETESYGSTSREPTTK